jgi:hypothetical protein
MFNPRINHVLIMEGGYSLSIGLEDGTKLGPKVLSKRAWPT